MHEPLHHYYPWDKFEDKKQFRSCVREFLDNGAFRFVLTAEMLVKMLVEKDYAPFLHDVCRDMDVEFTAVHGLAGSKYDLDLVEKDRRPGMFEDHIRALRFAAEFGCRNYVVHVGAYAFCTQHHTLPELRPLAAETLEKLLPEAEKLGMIVAVENSFEPPNSAAEVLALVRRFEGHPAIGVCYDTGHAHCMEPEPGKDKKLYEPYFATSWWWEQGIVWEDHALETLKDCMVTCHIHDNTGYGDYHGMPFDGTINWRDLMARLRDCPKLKEFQSEVCMYDGENWAGKLLAPPGGYSIRCLTETFRRLGF